MAQPPNIVLWNFQVRAFFIYSVSVGAVYFSGDT